MYGVRWGLKDSASEGDGRCPSPGFTVDAGGKERRAANVIN